MPTLLLGLLIGIVALPATAYFHMRFGYAPVTTAASPLPLEKTLAHLALNARIAKEAPKQAPFVASEADLTSGAQPIRSMLRGYVAASCVA